MFRKRGLLFGKKKENDQNHSDKLTYIIHMWRQFKLIWNKKSETMRNNETISTIMTRNLITVKPESSLKDAEKVMKRNHIRHIPVAKGDNLLGIVSLTDLQRLSFVDSFGDDEEFIDTAIYKMLTIDQIMIKKPITIEATQPITEAAKVLAEKEFHALPVLDNGKLVGIITTTDLIRYMIQYFEVENPVV